MTFLEIEEIFKSPVLDVKVNVSNTKLSDARIEKAGKKACVLNPRRLQGRDAKLLLVRQKSFCNENLVQFCLAANASGYEQCR